MSYFEDSKKNCVKIKKKRKKRKTRKGRVSAAGRLARPIPVFMDNTLFMTQGNRQGHVSRPVLKEERSDQVVL